MSDINLDNIKNKVKKLLALGTSPNPAEAAVALEKANAILLQYNLEMSEIKTINVNGIVEETYMNGRAEREHETILISTIARYNMCEVIHKSIGREFSLNFIGKSHNILAAKIMCDYVFEALDKSARKEAYGQGKKAVFSYKLGYCNTLAHKLMTMIKERDQKVTPECTALVVMEQAENKKYMEDMYKNLKQVNLKQAEVKDAYAFFAGQLAAQKLSLNQQIKA